MIIERATDRLHTTEDMSEAGSTTLDRCAVDVYRRAVPLVQDQKFARWFDIRDLPEPMVDESDLPSGEGAVLGSF